MRFQFMAKGLLTGSLSVLAMSALAMSAAAQEVPSADTRPAANDESIVVYGQPDPEIDGGDVRQQTRAITQRGSVVGQPLARFQQPVCVGVWGLSGESAQFIIDRIYYNAENAGLQLDEREGCAANVIVAFVPDPHQDFMDMRQSEHHLVAPLTLSERKRVSDTPGPVLAWNLVSTRTRDGQARSGNPPTFESTEISRLNSGTRRDMELSVVLIDIDMLADLDGVAVSDYATMRALARTLPPDAGEANYATVLSLFDDPVRAPQQMTEFDRAYLTSLYTSRANMPGNLALRNVDELMEREAEAE